MEKSLNKFNTLTQEIQAEFAKLPEFRHFIFKMTQALQGAELARRSGALNTATANMILSVVPSAETLHGLPEPLKAKIQELNDLAHWIVKNPQEAFSQYRENAKIQTTANRLTESARANNSVQAIKMLGLHCNSKTLQTQNFFDPLKPVINVPEHELRNILAKMRPGFRFGDFEVVNAYQISKKIENSSDNQKGVSIKVGSDYHPDEIVDVKIMQDL